MKNITTINYNQLIYNIIKSNKYVDDFISDDDGKIGIYFHSDNKITIIEYDIYNNLFKINNKLFEIKRPNVIILENIEINRLILDRCSDLMRVDTIIFNNTILNIQNITIDNNKNINYNFYVSCSNCIIKKHNIGLFSKNSDCVKNGIYNFKGNLYI